MKKTHILLSLIGLSFLVASFQESQAQSPSDSFVLPMPTEEEMEEMEDVGE